MRVLTLAVLVLAACNTSTQTRAVQGRLTGTSAQTLVISETASGEQTVTQAGDNGTFTVHVATNQPVTLLVANRTADGTVVVTRHIGPTWFRVKPGPTIVLGTVRPEGEPVGQLDPVTTMTPQQCPTTPGEADLPYDAKVALGQTWRLADAFAEKGPQPKAVIEVTMEGTPWRLEELRSGVAFTVTQADCDHAGNKDIGRDRVFVTWENADGSRETDHLDMRYCESDGAPSSASSSSTDDDAEDCDLVEHDGCGSHGSSCDDDSQLEPVPGMGTCPGEGPTETTPSGGTQQPPQID